MKIILATTLKRYRNFENLFGKKDYTETFMEVPPLRFSFIVCIVPNSTITYISKACIR